MVTVFINTTKINNRTRKTYKHARDLHLLYLDPRRIYCSREPINGICRVLFGGSEAFNKQREVEIKKESFVVAGSIAVHFPSNKKDISSAIFEINGFYKYEICINNINQSINQ